MQYLSDFLKVRAVIALSFTFVTICMFIKYGTAPTDLIAINALVVGHYFGNRSALDKPNGCPEI